MQLQIYTFRPIDEIMNEEHLLEIMISFHLDCEKIFCPIT